MKIKVTLTIDLDESEWAAANGVRRDQVTADVKKYVQNVVQNSVEIDSASGEVEAR